MEYETVFAIDNVVTEGAEYEATEPTVALLLPEESEFYPDGDWGEAAYYGYEFQDYYSKYSFYYEIAYSVTPVEGTEVCSVLVDTDSYTLGADAATKAGQVWGGTLGSWNTNTTTEFYESSYRYFNHYEDEPAPALVLCVSWKDAEGNLYYKEYQLQESMQYYADLMLAKIYGETEPEEPAEPAELTLEGKQWIFTWEAMGCTAMVDFSVSKENYLYIAYDATDYGHEGYLEYIGAEYTVTPTDETSGVVTLMSYNMYGELMTMNLMYSNLTETTCDFFCQEIYLLDFDGNPIRATLSEVNHSVMPNGVAM